MMNLRGLLILGAALCGWLVLGGCGGGSPQPEVPQVTQLATLPPWPPPGNTVCPQGDAKVARAKRDLEQMRDDAPNGTAPGLTAAQKKAQRMLKERMRMVVTRLCGLITTRKIYKANLVDGQHRFGAAWYSGRGKCIVIDNHTYTNATLPGDPGTTGGHPYGLDTNSALSWKAFVATLAHEVLHATQDPKMNSHWKEWHSYTLMTQLYQLAGCISPQWILDKQTIECAASRLVAEAYPSRLFPHDVPAPASLPTGWDRVKYHRTKPGFFSRKWRCERVRTNGVVETAELDSSIPYGMSCAVSLSSVPFLVLAGTNDDEDRGYITILPPDASNEFCLFTAAAEVSILTASSSLRLPAAVEVDPDTNTVYVLDWYSKSIYRLLDTNSDGVPDSLDATPVATDSSFPALADALAMRIERDGQGALCCRLRHDTVHRIVENGFPSSVTTEYVLSDDDADGDFDTEHALDIDDVIVSDPGIVVVPCDGDDDVYLVGAKGDLVEVVRDDGASGLTVIGSAVIVDPRLGDLVTLNTALTAGETIFARLAGQTERHTEQDVQSELPIIFTYSPYGMARTGDVIAVTGRNFLSGMTAEVDGEAVAVTVLDENTAEVTIPALPVGLEDLESSQLRFENPGEGTYAFPIFYDPPL